MVKFNEHKISQQCLWQIRTLLKTIMNLYNRDSNQKSILLVYIFCSSPGILMGKGWGAPLVSLKPTSKIPPNSKRRCKRCADYSVKTIICCIPSNTKFQFLVNFWTSAMEKQLSSVYKCLFRTLQMELGSAQLQELHHQLHPEHLHCYWEASYSTEKELKPFSPSPTHLPLKEHSVVGKKRRGY